MSDPAATPLVPYAETTRFPVFLSSVCSESDHLPAPETQVWALRESIFNEIGNRTEVYVDEQLFRDTATDSMMTVDRLVPRIREADAFVCILAAPRPGSPIKVGPAISQVTYFEIELFQAALRLRNTPLYVFIRDDFTPSARMTGILQLIESVFPYGSVQGQMSDARIKEEVRKIVDRARQDRNPLQRLTGLLPTAYNRLVRYLHALRFPREPYSQLRLLDGRSFTGGPSAQGTAVDTLIEMVGADANAERQLSRLWLALRELMARPFAQEEDPRVLEQWNTVLARWATAGAWYGLHGHTPIGMLAALNSATDVKNRMQAQGFLSNPAEIAKHGGALASAKYSIGRRLRGRHKSLLLREALLDLEKAHVPGARGEVGVLLIRGSILMHLRDKQSGIESFKHALQVSESNPAAPQYDVGQAMSELGFAYLRCFRCRNAVELCEESIPLLRAGGNPGFLARGLRKLSWAYFANGNISKWRKTREELQALIKEYGLYDQAH